MNRKDKFLGYKIRYGSTKLAGPYKIMYTKAQKEVAIPSFCGYNIQLPVIAEMKPDFSSSLYSWCYMLYTANTEMKSAKEVVHTWNQKTPRKASC